MVNNYCWLTSMTSYSVLVLFSIVLLPSNVISAGEGAADKVSIRVYSDGDFFEYMEYSIKDGVKMLEESPNYLYDISKPMLLLIHGMKMRADSRHIRATMDAFVKSGKYAQYNILAFNFPLLMADTWNNRYYMGVTANSKVVGGIIGDFLVEAIREGLTDPSRIIMIGYCLGAHIAGYASRRIRQDYETPVEYIAGLDPAGVGYGSIFGMKPITRLDARIVHLFHSNAFFYATRYYRGTADFIFNGGIIQPECMNDKLGLFACSHVRVVSYFVESIMDENAFVARGCLSFSDFNKCRCNSQETKMISFPPDESAIGEYYLMTRAEAPFGMGEAGSVCASLTLMYSPWMLLAH